MAHFRGRSLGLLLGLCCCYALTLTDAARSTRFGRLGSNPQSAESRAAIPEVVAGYARYDEASRTFSFAKGLGDGQQGDAPAYGSFSDPLRHKSNFGQLRITTNPAFSDEVQMQAAGFLEGYLTAERIFDYAHNMKAWLATQTNDSFAIGDWLFEQDRWARQQVAAAASGSPPAPPSPPGSPPPPPSFWPTVGLLLGQMDGLLAGYSAALADRGADQGQGRRLGEQQEAAGVEAGAEGSSVEGSRGKGGRVPGLERLTKWDFLVLNALGDMDDLLGVVFPDTDDGGDPGDYEDGDEVGGSGAAPGSMAATAAAGAAGRRQRRQGRPVRRPNADRDGSFFFRHPEDVEGGPQEAAKGAEAAAAEAAPVPRRGPWSGLSPGQLRSRTAKSGRCSALIKVTPGLDDLLLGHVTWWGYASMLRIYKHYNLRLAGVAGAKGGQANGRVSFSSYPGQLSSADDWYLLGSGLAVTETSLDVYDHNRYNASYGTGPDASLLAWQRVGSANLLAERGDGRGWARLAAAYNGGTYNNQYMIVDISRFTPGRELQPGLLTVMEIIPGMTRVADATPDLERGHWPSYNVPYFDDVYEATGYARRAAAIRARGPRFAAAADDLSYQLAPRAKIFRRDAAGANDLASFARLLRSNGWGASPADPLAAASPWDALCGRGDLNPDDPDVYGCYDGKVTNYSMALQLRSWAINGPTTEGGQPAFRWDAHPRFARVPHRGMPDVFDTEWEEQAP